MDSNNIPVVFYGEVGCQATQKNGKLCHNKAYYTAEIRYVCGVHSKEGKRIILPKNPDKKKQEQQTWNLHLEEAKRHADHITSVCHSSLRVSELHYIISDMINQIEAVRKIQHWWLEISMNPYHPVGIKLINQRYDKLFPNSDIARKI